MRANSDFDSQVEVVYQKIKPHKQYVEVSHVTDTNDHRCGQACCNTCSEDVGLFLSYHHVHLEKWFEKPTQKNLECY